MRRIASLAVGIVSAFSLLAVASPARADANVGAGASMAANCEARIGGLYQYGGAAPNGLPLALPSNAPALLLVDAQPNSYEMASTVTAELLDGDRKIAFDAPTRDSNGLNRLVLPTNAIGTHRISVDAKCGPGSYSTGPKEISLEIGGPVPFPTSVGALMQTPEAGPPTGIATFDLEPATNVRAFLPVIQFWSDIDGTKSVAIAGATSTTRLQITVKTGAVCVENGALIRDKRNVKLRVGGAIAGVERTLDEASVDISVDCGAIKWTRESDFGNEPTDGTNTGTPSGGQTTSTGGCSAAPGLASSATTASFAALGLAALVVARRRRRRQA